MINGKNNPGKLNYFAWVLCSCWMYVICCVKIRDPLGGILPVDNFIFESTNRKSKKCNLIDGRTV